MIEQRRDPDAFLTLLKHEGEDAQARGRLKIFFGYAAGVGKTYAMLEAARRAQVDKIDVVVGYAETHKRKETAALLEGLEVLPRKKIEYKGTILEELDIDAAIQRKPQLILVDELAHTNAEGCRHAKRWQDVQELLSAGIDVYTTLNVQHLETLNDKVNQITRVEVRERVPESFLEQANEIAVVDIAPDDLLQRLKEGKVYLPEQARTAMDNFFRKGNLIALREMALLFAAERVEEQMQQYREGHRIKSTWPASERILVAVSASPGSARLVRAGRRIAQAMKAEWIVANVETPTQSEMKEADHARLMETLRLAAELGAQVVEIQGYNVSEEVIKCAVQFNASKIIIGKHVYSRLHEILHGSIADNLIRQSGAIDVYVITGDGDDASSSNTQRGRHKSSGAHYIKSALVVVAATAVAKYSLPYLELANIVMIYLLGVVIVSMRYSRGASIFASIASVAAFDFFCVPPFYTFAVSDTQYIFTFIVMLTVALVISTLNVRMRLHTDAARQREQRTASLYRMSRDLASTEDLVDLYNIGLKHISEVFDASSAIIIPNRDSLPASIMLGPAKSALDGIDLAVADWVMHNNQIAGYGSQTLPGATALYLPLVGTSRTLAVLAIRPYEQNRFSRTEQLQLLHTFVNQLSSACERAVLSHENSILARQSVTRQIAESV